MVNPEFEEWYNHRFRFSGRDPVHTPYELKEAFEAGQHSLLTVDISKVACEREPLYIYGVSNRVGTMRPTSQPLERIRCIKLLREISDEHGGICTKLATAKAVQEEPIKQYVADVPAHLKQQFIDQFASFGFVAE